MNSNWLKSLKVTIFVKSSLMNNKDSNSEKANYKKIPDKSCSEETQNDHPRGNRDQLSCLERTFFNLS